MKTLITVISLLITLLSNAQASTPSNDLTCKIAETKAQLTLSHYKDTTYIVFDDLNDDPEADGVVIKLNNETNDVQQVVGNNDFDKSKYFVLRGTDKDIEGSVAITYAVANGKPQAYYTEMNALGDVTTTFNCIPSTIKVNGDLITKGLSFIPFMK